MDQQTPGNGQHQYETEMNGQENEGIVPEWRFLWELKVAAQAASDVYISVSLLGGHYVRIAAKDFLEAINDMQALGDTHGHPKRFQFTIENGILWVHASRMPMPRKAPPPEEGSP